MTEKAWAMYAVLSKDPVVLAATPTLLRGYTDRLADEKFGPGRWRRVSFEAAPFCAEPWRTDREMAALHLTGGDREAADDLLSQEGAVPEDAHVWRAVAGYEPLGASDA